jgi:hypothetical protein
MHGYVINVLTNVDKTQSILPCLPHDGVAINVFFKQCFEYKSPYMLENVCPNMVMVILRDLIETPLCKDLNVIIHHQWASFFASYMNSNFKFLFIIMHHLITLILTMNKHIVHQKFNDA